VLLLLVAATGWLVVRVSQAHDQLLALQELADRTTTDARAFRLADLSADLVELSQRASVERSLTSDPVWWLAAQLPGPGRNAAVVRTAARVLDDVAKAARPLQQALPALSAAQLRASGRINTTALSTAAAATAKVAQAVAKGDATLAEIRTSGLRGDVRDGVASLRRALDAARGPLASAAPVLAILAPILGAQGQRTLFVALENDAESRGTGGIVGAYAILRTRSGAVTLVRSASRKSLPSGPVIPTTGLPKDYLQLWGSDPQEWAGLNLSPHWPYTGQLVENGWRKQAGTSLDAVVGLDQYVVAGLLAGTGPVTVHGVAVNAQDAVGFLSKDIYAQFPDVADKDAVVGELVKAVFARLIQGHVDLRALVDGLRGPVSEHRLTVWSSHPGEEGELARLAVGGVLPDDPGPVIIPVINNGGGNKLDAYLRVATTYRQGDCLGDVRLSEVEMHLTNSAPKSGLPDYVVARPDRLELQERPTVRGANRVLIDLYGPVDAEAALVTLDGKDADVSTGQERDRPVWSLDVELKPGQTRSVTFQLLQPVTRGQQSAIEAPRVLLQPMALPARARAIKGGACGAAGTTS
jgi:Protein of unknown function (DUF4012)